MGCYKVFKASTVRQQWSAVVNEVVRDRTRILVEKSGVPVGVVSPQDLAWLEARDRDLAELRAAMDDMRKAFRDIPPEAFHQAVAQALQELRMPTHDTPRP